MNRFLPDFPKKTTPLTESGTLNIGYPPFLTIGVELFTLERIGENSNIFFEWNFVNLIINVINLVPAIILHSMAS